MNKKNKLLIAVACATLSVIAPHTSSWAQSAEGQTPAAPDASGGATPASADAPAATPAQSSATPSAPAPGANASVPSASAPGNLVYIAHDIDFANPKGIDQAIIVDCQLPQQSADLLEAALRKGGFSVIRDSVAANAGKGRILKVEITYAMSQGHAWGFGGQHKELQMRGRLFEDGNEVSGFVAKRGSMGGALAAFKNSCSVLVRCADALADDIARWLKDPVQGARIGEW
jgi:hypothetical protein